MPVADLENVRIGIPEHREMLDAIISRRRPLEDLLARANEMMDMMMPYECFKLTIERLFELSPGNVDRFSDLLIGFFIGLVRIGVIEEPIDYKAVMLWTVNEIKTEWLPRIVRLMMPAAILHGIY